jgi:peptidoglycan hydrolase CwlO-like protein
MPNEDELEKQLEKLLEQQLADAHARIREMIQEIDRRDALISDLQRRIKELEQACQDAPRQGTV